MADDNIQRPPDPLHPAPAGDQATTATPPTTAPPRAGDGDRLPVAPAPAPLGEMEAAGRRSEVEQFLRWGAGLVLVLAAGWGFIALVAYAAYKGNFRIELGTAAALASVLSLVLFVVLQRNLWLSRFMGLRTEANPSPLKEAFILWLLGVPGLLWRSTERAGAAPADQKTQSEVSNTREVIETVVFVVVLVLLLKSFVAEAFVIPTGSMATTLYGYQKIVTCPKCKIQFPVNCSQEVDPQEGARQVIEGCVCPNCREPIQMAKRDNVEKRDPRTGQKYTDTEMRPLPGFEANTGDRVLVAKFLYDLPWRSPERLDVVVFKYPERPQKDYTPLNYIKRLTGLPGETIAIHYGKLYFLRPDKGLKYDDGGVDPLDLWQYKYMHVDDKAALDLFRGGKFEIVRKPHDVILAERRLVYDNDHPASDIKEQRWVDPSGAKAWAEDEKARTFKHAAGDDARLAWLRYRHLIVRGGRNKPELITDFMDYNSWQDHQTYHWVGDLMVECEVTVEKAEGQFVLELSRGTHRFRALFDLATGGCTLKTIKHGGKGAPADGAGEELATKPTDLKKPGTYHVRFANVDDRLLVWVDKGLPFGDGVPYTPPEEQKGPTEANDLEPASVGVRGGGVTVGQLQLWRDTYYTQMRNKGDHGDGDDYPDGIDFAEPNTWGPLHAMHARTLYVQPGHYLCMGDNSPHSSDGRAWGLVPERLMLGRALVVYYPFTNHRFGPIH